MREHPTRLAPPQPAISRHSGPEKARVQGEARAHERDAKPMAECPWCRAPFRPAVRGGQAKRFCSAACKNAFGTAARRYACAMMDAGLLSVDDLKRVSASRTARTAPFRFPAVRGRP